LTLPGFKPKIASLKILRGAPDAGRRTQITRREIGS
jgi:hypothetical protein